MSRIIQMNSLWVSTDGDIFQPPTPILLSDSSIKEIRKALAKTNREQLLKIFDNEHSIPQEIWHLIVSFVDDVSCYFNFNKSHLKFEWNEFLNA